MMHSPSFPYPFSSMTLFKTFQFSWSYTVSKFQLLKPHVRPLLHATVNSFESTPQPFMLHISCRTICSQSYIMNLPTCSNNLYNKLRFFFKIKFGVNYMNPIVIPVNRWQIWQKILNNNKKSFQFWSTPPPLNMLHQDCGSLMNISIGLYKICPKW